MFVCVFHRDIKNWQSFDDLGAQVAHAPDGCEALAYFPAKDHKSAVYLWRTNDFNGLKQWIDGHFSNFCTHEFCEIDERKAMGLPKMAIHPVSA